MDEATRWQAGRLVREYAAAVRGLAGDGAPTTWFDWAAKVADELDPAPVRVRKLN